MVALSNCIDETREAVEDREIFLRVGVTSAELEALHAQLLRAIRASD